MSFKKLGFPLLVIMEIILFQLHLLPLHAHPLQNTSTIAPHQEPIATDIKVNEDTGMTRKLEVITGLKLMVTVDRRGGGSGSHGGGGHGGGHGSHSTGSSVRGGDATGNGNGGDNHRATVVPLYAHRQHGSNKGTQSHDCPSYLVLVVLAASIIQCFA